MKMLSEVLPDVRLVNIVDDSLLADVMREGKVTPAITRKMCHYVLAAEQTGAQASMARLESQISQKVGKPVFSSPRLCVEKVKQMLERL